MCLCLCLCLSVPRVRDDLQTTPKGVETNSHVQSPQVHEVWEQAVKSNWVPRAVGRCEIRVEWPEMKHRVAPTPPEYIQKLVRVPTPAEVRGEPCGGVFADVCRRRARTAAVDAAYVHMARAPKVRRRRTAVTRAALSRIHPPSRRCARAGRPTPGVSSTRSSSCWRRSTSTGPRSTCALAGVGVRGRHVPPPLPSVIPSFLPAAAQLSRVVKDPEQLDAMKAVMRKHSCVIREAFRWAGGLLWGSCLSTRVRM